MMGFLSDDDGNDSEFEEYLLKLNTRVVAQRGQQPPQDDPLNDDESEEEVPAEDNPTSSDDEDPISELLRELNAVRVEYQPGERPCKFANCTTPTTRKYCVFHMGPVCSEGGCTRKPWKKGKCRRHNNFVPAQCSVVGNFSYICYTTNKPS